LPDIEYDDGGWDGDEHAWTSVRDGEELIGVDIPPGVYETGGGYNWEPRMDIDSITPEDVVIWKI
jgi:hypothetical protein